MTEVVGRAQAATAPAAHTVQVIGARDGEIELRHTGCRAPSWKVPVETVAAVTMLDLVHTVVDHVCVA